MADRIIYQPIHPEIRSQLDPEYIAFHEEHLQYVPLSEDSAWDPAQRLASSPFVSTLLESVDVGSIQDVILEHAELRIFTPRGTKPAKGWPVFLWFHGGGWTLGDLNSDNALCSRIAEGASCIAVNVNYRHAPEDPYPAAVNDSLEALQWFSSHESSRLGIDRGQIAIGGTSAGGNLAAILSMRAAQISPPLPLVAQLLILPVIDNTALPNSNPWLKNRFAPWLSPSRMLWYRRKYLPDEKDCLAWTASPNLASPELLRMSPKTWIAVAECDLLAGEACLYGGKLQGYGVHVDIKSYKGCTHSLLAASGLFTQGRTLVEDTIIRVKEAFAV